MGRVKEWAMQLEEEDRFSICCGAHSIGEIHHTGGRDMGMCADCHDHAEFAPMVNQDDIAESDKQEVEELAKRSSVTLIGSQLIERLHWLLYNATLLENDAGYDGNAHLKSYARGKIDALEAAIKAAREELGIPCPDIDPAI